LAFFDGAITFTAIHIGDLLGGLGLAASVGVSFQGIRSFQEILENKLGLQQVSNFHAIVCDLVGVPRRDRPGLPKPKVAERVDEASYGIEERRWSLLKVSDERLKELREHGA
ncbi:MAG: hypothetical protein AAF514_14610, partial [Verrucomicrobiota bacterium]